MDPIALRDQIDRILHSRSFANKSQLRKLLEILFKNIDSQSVLKPDVVIQELWPAETRTKRAADVATEMNRLRHALETYYQEEGKEDAIAISLPNRSASAADGTHEKRWIVALPRNGTEIHAPVGNLAAPQASPRRRLKQIGVLAALCAIVALTAYFTIRMLVLPDQPKIGRLDGSALVIMDADGKELWRKVFPGGFGPDWYYAQWQPTRIWFGDLEGKGHTSVLFSYSPVGAFSHSSTLICYSDRGKEKWRWTPGRVLPELAGSPATFVTHAVRILKPTDK